MAHWAPDAVFAVTTPALRAMQRSSLEIPIVFALVIDPVGQGFVSSFARPGGNITGTAQGEFGVPTRQLDLLKRLAPGLQRIALLYDSDQPSAVGIWPGIEAAAPLLALSAVKMSVRTAEDIEQQIMALAREPNSGLIVVRGPTDNRNRELIGALALRYRLPTAHYYRYFVESGGLASYGPTRSNCAAVRHPMSIVFCGAKSLPICRCNCQPSSSCINLKTAKALGLTIPPNLLAIADEVIE